MNDRSHPSTLSDTAKTLLSAQGLTADWVSAPSEPGFGYDEITFPLSTEHGAQLTVIRDRETLPWRVDLYMSDDEGISVELARELGQQLTRAADVAHGLNGEAI